MKAVQPSVRREKSLLRFGRDRRGVAAVEFAFIAPVMIILYFGMAELCTLMMADRRTSHTNSAIGDLAAQAATLHDSDVADIFAVANTVFRPFDTSTLELRLTGVILNGSKDPKVEWSDLKAPGQTVLTPLLCNAAVTNFPPDLKTAAGVNIVMAEAVYKYTSPIAFWQSGELRFKPRFFTSPRFAKVARYKGASATPVACTIS